VLNAHPKVIKACTVSSICSEYTLPTKAFTPRRHSLSPTSPLNPTSSRRRHSLLQLTTKAVDHEAAATGWWTKGDIPPNFIHITGGVTALLDQLQAHQKNLIVLDLFAPWCAACRSLYPKLLKTAAANPDVIFLAMNFDENKPVAKQLGIKVLPYFQLYRGSDGKVAEFSCSVAKIQRLRDALEEHSCDEDGCPFDPDSPVQLPEKKEAQAV